MNWTVLFSCIGMLSFLISVRWFIMKEVNKPISPKEMEEKETTVKAIIRNINNALLDQNKGFNTYTVYLDYIIRNNDYIKEIGTTYNKAGWKSVVIKQDGNNTIVTLTK